MENETKMVKFDLNKLMLLKKRYDSAVLLGHESFMFEGGEYVTTYAKYVIEYLEGRLNDKSRF